VQIAKILNRKLSESMPFAKAYLKASLDEIRVTGEMVSLSGGNSAMANLIAANGTIDGQTGVPSFMPAWWARQDSNLRQHRYERCVLTAELQARPAFPPARQ
jgi:hypothetical protein